MRGSHRNRRCLPFALGRAGLPVILTALSLMFLLPAFAQQDTLKVPSDIPPGAGNLNKAVQAVITARTLSNAVFELEPNGCYILVETITIPPGKYLTIIASEPGQTQETAPPQVVWSSSSEMWRDVYYFKHTFMFDCYGDIALKNVWLLYANTEAQQIGANFQIQDDPEANATGKGEVAEFDGVIFYYSCVPPNASGAVGVTAKHFKGSFKIAISRIALTNTCAIMAELFRVLFEEVGFHKITSVH